jgi:hypothetical protein
MCVSSQYHADLKDNWQNSVRLRLRIDLVPELQLDRAVDSREWGAHHFCCLIACAPMSNRMRVHQLLHFASRTNRATTAEKSHQRAYAPGLLQPTSWVPMYSFEECHKSRPSFRHSRQDILTFLAIISKNQLLYQYSCLYSIIPRCALIEETILMPVLHELDLSLCGFYVSFIRKQQRNTNSCKRRIILVDRSNNKTQVIGRSSIELGKI